MTELNKVIKARAKLMKGHIGMASMLLHLDLVEVNDPRCSTMATDGKRIIFNSDFVAEISEEELRGVLLHEALHVVYEHPIRRGSRHSAVWNISCDYAINGFLVYEMGVSLPDGGLLSREYHGQSAEVIYRKLINDEDSLQSAIDQMEEGNDESEDSNSSGDTGDESEDGYSFPSAPQTGQQVGDIDLDSIPSPVGEVWDCTSEDGKKLSEAEITELKGEIQRAVSMSDKLEKAMGKNGTSSVSTRMEELKEVKIDWKQLLSDFLQSTVSDDQTWQRMNRRHAWRGIYLPSKAKSPHGGEMAVIIDSSGSVCQFELDVFATEIQAMAEQCGLDKIRVCYCDTRVRKNAQGDYWDIFELDQGEELELRARGGGGTNFDPPYHLFNDWDKYEYDPINCDVSDVQAIIYFTDGYGRASAEVEPCAPVVWCVTNDRYRSDQQKNYLDRLPFGEVVKVELESMY